MNYREFPERAFTRGVCDGTQVSARRHFPAPSIPRAGFGDRSYPGGVLCPRGIVAQYSRRSDVPTTQDSRNELARRGLPKTRRDTVPGAAEQSHGRDLRTDTWRVTVARSVTATPGERRVLLHGAAETGMTRITCSARVTPTFACPRLVPRCYTQGGSRRDRIGMSQVPGCDSLGRRRGLRAEEKAVWNACKHAFTPRFTYSRLVPRYYTQSSEPEIQEERMA